jgi:hypothetical protein
MRPALLGISPPSVVHLQGTGGRQLGLLCTLFVATYLTMSCMYKRCWIDQVSVIVQSAYTLRSAVFHKMMRLSPGERGHAVMRAAVGGGHFFSHMRCNIHIDLCGCSDVHHTLSKSGFTPSRPWR